MIRKSFVDDGPGPVARITFTLPASLWADIIHLVGDFNDWDSSSHPLTRGRSGEWSCTVDLEVGRTYQFRYLVDGNEWTYDSQADTYVHDSLYGNTFVVVTDPDFTQCATS